MALADLTVASTTDSEVEVKAALAGPTAKVEEAKVESEEPEPKGEEAQNAGDESETSQAEDEESESAAASEAAKEEEDEAEEEEKPGSTKLQKRLDKLTREKYDLRDENRDLRDRLAAIEAKTSGKEPVVNQPKDDPKPERAGFKTDDEYFEALGRWGARQETAKLQAKEAKRASDEQLREIWGNYNRGVLKFSEKHPDFQEVLGDSNLIIPIAVQTALINFEAEGAALAYHLATNPELVEKMAGMSETRAVAEVGKLHAKLFPEGASEDAAKPIPKPKPKVNKPAEPIKPVRVASTNTSVRLDELPYREYKKIREEQTRRR